MNNLIGNKYVYSGTLLLSLLIAVIVFSAQSGFSAFEFTAPATLNTNADTDSGSDYNPQIATDGSGNWVAVWESIEDLGGTAGTDRDIFVSRSMDNGATWTAPATLNTNADTDSGNDQYPQVTTDCLGNWVAVWESFENLGGTAGTEEDIFVSRSTDNGATWTAPATLNTSADTDSGWDARPQITTDGSGSWVAVWESNENLGGTAGTDTDIFVSRSIDNGATWTAPATLNTNADTDLGGDALQKLVTDGSGNWIAVWSSRENLGGTIGADLDIFVSRSTDNGATWSAPASLNINASTDSGNDWYPQVTTDGLGNWVAVWNSDEDLGSIVGTDYDIFVSRSIDNGVIWTAPATLNTNADTDSGWDTRPQITTDGSGSWVTVWYSIEDLGGTAGTDRDIFVSRSTDNGVTWTAPSTLSSNADTDSGDDFNPQITTDGSGSWIAVWNSDEDLGGTTGTDHDIFVSTSSFTPVNSWQLY